MKSIQIFPKKYGFFPYVFLIYLIMPFFYVKSETGIKEVIGYALLLLFLVTYRQLYSKLSLRQFSGWLTIQLMIIVILSLWYHPNNLYMGFFPANFIGWLVTKKIFYRALTFFALTLVMTTVINTIQGLMDEMLYFYPFLIVMIISPFGIRSLNKQMELEQQLDQANAQIKELIQKEERVRIARDLHDTLGHTLSLITLQSQLVQRLTREMQPEEASRAAKEIEVTSRSALRQVRELVSDMRTITILDELLNLEQILKTADIVLVKNIDAAISSIPILQQNIIGMCLREAGTNIVKHSKAKQCVVTVTEERGFLIISVLDDGIGFSGNCEKGNGLKGIEERLTLLDGILKINSDSNTTLTMKVPVVMKEEKEGVAI